MSLSTKIIMFVLAVLLLIGGGLIVFKQFEIARRQEAIEKEMVGQKELADGITRALAQYATKQDINNLAKENNVNMKVIQNDLDKLNASIMAINVVTSKSQGQVVKGAGSTNTVPGTDVPPLALTYPDPYKYQQDTQVIKLNESFGNVKVPIGEVSFSAWKEKPWDYNIPPREYKMVTVLGMDEQQRQYAYNKFTINDQEVKIANSTFKQEYPEGKFSFFNPRLYIGMDAGINLRSVRGEAVPNVSLQLMSYGKYKNNPDLSILQVGAGYGIDAKQVSGSLTPIMYNVGQHIPLMNNLYIGPSVQVNASGDVGIMGSAKVGL
jgi:uncharacterized protein YxeA